MATLSISEIIFSFKENKVNPLTKDVPPHPATPFDGWWRTRETRVAPTGKTLGATQFRLAQHAGQEPPGIAHKPH
ncbi:hypothetical protein ACFWVM_07555 [Nocardia fluminea]|uniref:hypothetical protein n=1 Tax=Nocardia fluminea TaxID=134984 RepID=UPI00366A22D8